MRTIWRDITLVISFSTRGVINGPSSNPCRHGVKPAHQGEKPAGSGIETRKKCLALLQTLRRAELKCPAEWAGLPALALHLCVSGHDVDGLGPGGDVGHGLPVVGDVEVLHQGVVQHQLLEEPVGVVPGVGGSQAEHPRLHLGRLGAWRDGRSLDRFSLKFSGLF